MDLTDPIEHFRTLQARAAANGEAERGTAMTLATSTPDGAPSARMVLLKGVDAEGFVFYTNYASRKAAELDAAGRAALVFFWPSMGVQVRVEGAVAKVSDAESDEYFASRPRQSQLGAWASRQSQPMGGRRELIGRYLQEKARRLGRPVPRPPHWGGYRVAPTRIEFWVSKLGRLHDRHSFRRTDEGTWTHELLFP